jgi:hypothetical protein
MSTRQRPSERGVSAGRHVMPVALGTFGMWLSRVTWDRFGERIETGQLRWRRDRPPWDGCNVKHRIHEELAETQITPRDVAALVRSLSQAEPSVTLPRALFRHSAQEHLRCHQLDDCAKPLSRHAGRYTWGVSRSLIRLLFRVKFWHGSIPQWRLEQSAAAVTGECCGSFPRLAGVLHEA